MLWWLAGKIIALFLIAFGVFLTVFLTGVGKHQEVKGRTNFGVTGIVIGVISIIVGGFLLFSP